MVNPFNLFRPGWQHGNAVKRLKAVSKITCRKTLRRIAAESSDDRLRYLAACRLNDHGLIRRLAYSAGLETIRLSAGILTNEQAGLASIALSAWDIDIGNTAVRHISNPLLLRRIARSAKQDAIRLAAAMKLDDHTLLRSVARSSSHVDVHWQVAQHLDDPCLLAEVSLFNPANPRLEPIRRQARSALRDHIVRCWMNDDQPGLLAAMKTVPHPAFKIEAFVRLHPEQITPQVVRGLALLDLQAIPRDLVDRMIFHIKSSGWQARRTIAMTNCDFCHGKGELYAHYLTANDTWSDQDRFPCPDCDGNGKVAVQLLTCRKDGEAVTIRLPA